MIRRFGEYNQHQVGIIGVDIRNKTLTGSSPSPGTTLLDERESVQFQVKLLTGMGINKIIVLSHLGYARDKRWLADIEGIDVIVGGHTHTLLGRMETDEDLDDGDLDIADTDGTYPTVETSKTTGKPVCIVQAWKFAHGMGHLKVEWDGNGDVTACGGSFLFPFETHPDASEQDAAAVKNYLSSLTSPSFLEINEWLPAKERLQAYRDAMGNNGLDTVILSASDTICGPSKSSSCPLQSNAGQGGAACNLVAQSMLSGAADADVAIQNAGGCRADITAGNFTMENAAELLPYSDTLVTLNLTGSRIKNVLEQALHMTFKEDSSGSYPHAAGLRFDVDATKPMGERISNLQVNSRLGEGAWNDIDLVAIYTVVTNSFLAPAGRDGYEEFRNVSLVNDTQMSYMDSFVEYAEDISPLTNPDNETLSTQSYVGPSDSNESESEL